MSFKLSSCRRARSLAGGLKSESDALPEIHTDVAIPLATAHKHNHQLRSIPTTSLEAAMQKQIGERDNVCDCHCVLAADINKGEALAEHTAFRECQQTKS